MTNFKVVARPAARVRSIAAWSRLRGTFDMIMLNLPHVEAYYPMNDKDPSASAQFDNVVLALPNLEAYYPMNDKDSIVFQSFDVVMLGLPNLVAYYPMDSID